MTELPLAGAPRLAHVDIYTRPFCPYCARALTLLKTKGADYAEIADAYADAARKRAMVARAGGASTFPQIFVGDRHLGGCDEMMALDRRGELDALLAA